MSIQRLRGMHDIYGQDADGFRRVEWTAHRVFSRFGFEEIRTPILEEKELFSRALGTDTDVVQKEMYEFTDRSKMALAMRPEGTAGVVRAYLENNFDKDGPLRKFYYMGAMFRSERPQAGRLRQFHQAGVEILGTDSPLADAEAIHALAVFLDEAGAGDYKIKLNNLGTIEERKEFKEKLRAYFEPHKSKLCDDCKTRLERNVFRLLDCKVESCRQIARQSPPIADFLTTESKAHFEAVTNALRSSRLPYEVDPFMVRGLDYYTKTVFEFSHPKLGAQDALAAGGRYDRLVESFGGKPTGAVGFAVGIERLLMATTSTKIVDGSKATIFLVALGEPAAKEAFKALAELRSRGISAEMDLTPGSMKSQLRSADKRQCRFALIVGDTELQSGQWVLKNMKEGTQESVSRKDLVKILEGK